MIYVASPYSIIPPDWIKAGISTKLVEERMPALMESRYKAVMKYVAHRVLAKSCYFSPILYSHEMAKVSNFPKTFEWWANMNHKYIDVCNEVHVLQMQDWENSAGVRDEINYAIKRGIPIKFIEWEG